MRDPRVSHYAIIGDEHPKGAFRITNPKNKKMTLLMVTTTDGVRDLSLPPTGLTPPASRRQP
jgi:hypothetical protein